MVSQSQSQTGLGSNPSSAACLLCNPGQLKHSWTSTSPIRSISIFLYSSATEITLSPLVAGPTLETFVGAGINTILITNLLSGMDYNVKIFASQASGFSDALTGVVKTRKSGVLLPQPLHVVLLLCFHCTSTPASTWWLVFIFLSITLSGWCFVERKVCASLRAVIRRPGWQAQCQNLPFKYTRWWQIGFPSGKSPWHFSY